MSEPRVVRLPPGTSGVEDDEGGFVSTPIAKNPSGGKPGRWDRAAEKNRGKRRTAEQKAALSAAMEKAWAKRKASGGAARAGKVELSGDSTPGRRRGKPATRPATTAAPPEAYVEGFAPSRRRYAAYVSAYDEILRERDGLNIVLKHLGRLIGKEEDPE